MIPSEPTPPEPTQPEAQPEPYPIATYMQRRGNAHEVAGILKKADAALSASDNSLADSVSAENELPILFPFVVMVVAGIIVWLAAYSFYTVAH